MPSMHFHPEFEIYYLLDGTRYYFIEDRTYPIKKGALVLVDSMQIHRTSVYDRSQHDRFLIELTEEPFSAFLKNICGTTLAGIFAEYSGIWELDDASQGYVEGILNSITNEFISQSKNYQNMVMLKIAELLLFVSRKEPSKRFDPQSSTRKPKHDIINSVTEYILENYSTARSLDEISKHFYISKSYLCRIFKEVTGCTVQTYINMLSVKKAQELLEKSDLSIAALSESLGYGSITHFERMFRKYTETTPLKYRKKMRIVHQKVRERKPEKM